MVESRQIIADRFEIENLERDLLGRGGMGDVYRGRDTQTGQLVAIKALRPEVVTSDLDAVARFSREGEALRELDHHNIVKMVEAIEEDGRHYLVMEYVPSGSLRDLLEEQGGLSIERTVEIALDVADALTRAHRLGIVHRDLKPSNVLLAKDDTPRLTDFGHAHLATGPRLTQTGTVLGTVLYLSPEACRGETLDARADIWAFGVMLYEMLSGEVPFPGETFPTVFMAILSQSVPDLSQVRPDVPDALADLVYRMLEKDRAQRIPSVRQVGLELEAISEGYEADLLSVRGRRGPRSVQVGPDRERPSITESRFATPTPTATEAPTNNLPVQPTPFVGREAELAELDRLLNDPDVRLVTVLGAGGMGKTRLALEAAARHLDRYSDGVYWVSLAPLRTVEAIVPTVADALGFAFYGGSVALRQQLLDYLRQRNTLLLLDNYEHLLTDRTAGGVDLVSDILQVAPEVRILVTSRASLNVQGEHLYHIAGMEFPDWETPEDALEYSAVKLFMQSARRARPGYELRADDLKYISRICRLVGGMPLGILLAAAWMEMLSPEEIAHELAAKEGLDFLATGLRNAPERQRSIRAVFDHSWNLLAAPERAAMQALSVFRGGFTRGAAQEVTGASLRALMALVNRSLLHRAPTGRYEVHELLRQYVAEKLAESADAGYPVRDRHCAYYAVALETWGIELESSRELAALVEMDIEIDNARAAWDWAVERDRVDWLLQAYNGMYRFYAKRERRQEWKTACQQALAKLTAEGRPSADRQRLLAKLLVWQSSQTEGWTRETRVSELEQVLSLLEGPALADQDTRAERASILRAMSWYVVDLEQATRLLEQSLALFREIGDRPEMWGSFVGLRMMARYQGDLDKAKQWATECLATSRAMGAPIRIAGALTGLGNIAREQGQLQEAEGLHQEALALSREIGVWWGIADRLWQLGRTYIYFGRFDTAHALLAESLAISENQGIHSFISEESLSLARAAMHLGRYDQARIRTQVTLDYCRETDKLPEMASALLFSIRLALAEEAYGEADRLAQQVLAIHQKTGLQEGRAELAAFSAVIAYTSGKQEEMGQHVCQMLERTIREGRFRSLMLALAVTALLLTVRAQQERAVELYALASRYPYVANSQWFEDIAGSHIAAAAATLPPDVVAAAQARGRARDLWATVDELLAELEEHQVP